MFASPPGSKFLNPVAIIGGGITGLTTAYRLSQKKIPVTLYESSDRVGGPIQTLREKGYLSEFGPNTILETSPMVKDLIHDLGLDQRRWNADSMMDKNFVVRDGKLMPLPSNPASFVGCALFSLGSKLRIAAETLIRTPPLSPEESVADFIRRRFGKELLDYVIDPFVTGIYAGNPELLSVQHAFPKLLAMEKKYRSLVLALLLNRKEPSKGGGIPKGRPHKISFDEGLQVLPDSLQDRLGRAVQLRSEAIGLKQVTNGWEVTVRTAEEERTNLHSAVVLAAPAHQVARMKVISDRPVDLSILQEIAYPPVARIILGYRREEVKHPLDGFGVLVPKCEKFKILGTTFSSSLFPNRAPKGHVILTTFIGGCRQPELALESPDNLFSYAAHDLERLLGITGKPTYRHHVLYRRAIPQYNIGYQRYLDFMADTEFHSSGLFFSGNYRGGISLANSIVSGNQVAGRLEEFLSFPNGKSI